MNPKPKQMLGLQFPTWTNSGEFVQDCPQPPSPDSPDPQKLITRQPGDEHRLTFTPKG